MTDTPTQEAMDAMARVNAAVERLDAAVDEVRAAVAELKAGDGDDLGP